MDQSVYHLVFDSILIAHNPNNHTFRLDIRSEFLDSVKPYDQVALGNIYAFFQD